MFGRPDVEGLAASSTAEPASTGQADALLAMRVSELLARYPTMLQPLIDHGFGPLAQPALRAVLAPTVTLEQALRIRSLDEERTRDLMLCLVEIAESANGGSTGIGPAETGTAEAGLAEAGLAEAGTADNGGNEWQ